MIYISVGSNLGNRLNNIRKSLELIRSFNILTNIKHSIVLETNAIVEASASDEFNIPYLNMVISAETSLSPENLLQKLKEIELTMGRTPVKPKMGTTNYRFRYFTIQRLSA
jgi:2-amino-4-hydroxy-6-hydroxymethyldihydropteridine diphosphokinase